MLGKKIVEGEQRRAIHRQALSGLRALRAVLRDELLERPVGSFFVSAIQISVSPE